MQATPRLLPPGRRRAWLALLGPALIAPGVHAAAFLPGAEADPATGEVTTTAAASPAEPLRGQGIQWTLAPWRWGGSTSLDLRALRREDRSRVRQGLWLAEVDAASHVWQPWFMQLRVGLGLIATRAAGDAPGASGSGSSLTARAALAVFPASRFPFELRADLGDSRSSDVTLGSEYRSRRLSLSQSYRPPTGNDSYQLQLEHSALLDGVSRDTLTTFNATGVRQFDAHTADLGLSRSDNRRSSDDQHTALSAVTLRHSYRPAEGIGVETLASWNEVRLRGSALDLGSDVRQVSSFASWRLGGGEPLSEGQATQLSATARWVQSRALGGGAGADAQAFNVSVGATREITPQWRASLSANAAQVQASSAADGSSSGVQTATSWAGNGTLLAGWRYTPNLAANAGWIHDSRGQQRLLVGAQGAHGVSRNLPVGDAAMLALSLSQSAAVLRETGGGGLARAIAHTASLSWQSQAADGGQAFGGLSLSDSRSLGPSSGSFQLVNLQWTQRSQFTRHAGGSISLTAQASRNRASELDAFSGERRDTAQGWLAYYNGTLSWENQRAFGVPRLRNSVLLGVSSQPLERRALGDIDAPRERITESFEWRLDYAIGRLETRLSARLARVDERWVAAVQARAQRRF